MDDLQPNKKLLNHDFSGYKLASNAIPQVNSFPLTAAVNKVSRTSDQFSFSYTEIFEMHNHLYHDHFSNSIFFTDENQTINVIAQKGNDSVSFSAVLKIPINNNVDSKTSFSETLHFPTEELALVSDGYGCIYLIQTGIRSQLEEQHWSFVTPNPIFNFNEPAYVLSACMDQNLLHIVTLSIKELEDCDKNVFLHWIQIHVSHDNKCESSLNGVKVFVGKSVPCGHWLNDEYTHLMVIADNPFELVKTETYEKIKPSLTMDDEVAKFYCWHQSRELISISFDMLVTEQDVECQIKHNYIFLKLSNGAVLLDGFLDGEISVDASRWFVEKNKLEVILIKKSGNLFWNNVLKQGDKYGTHDILGEEQDRIDEVHEGLKHLTQDEERKESKESRYFNIQQLEECDEETEIERKLYSVNVLTGEIEVMKNLSSHQWLFIKGNGHNMIPPLICLRHDVDGILWQPSRNKNEEWEHVFTFNAFGYVYASKKDHKFITCNVPFNHVLITDCSSRIFIYEAGDFKRKQLNQYIVDLKNDDKILGCRTVQGNLYILTNKCINIVNLL